jgi:Ca-activated chloride channel homolog
MRARLAALVLVVASTASLTGQSQQQQPPPPQIFSSTVEAVRVDVLVTDGGRPVGGLTPKDFEVIDNGVPQQVDLASFEEIPLNLVLVFDMSESVVGERLDHLRQAAGQLLTGLKPQDQAALVTFNDAVMQGAALTADLARVRSGLIGQDGRGDTALLDAIYGGFIVGESSVGRALMIVFSDGVDTASFLTSEAVLDTAKRSDVVVYAVVAGAPPKVPLLRDLSELTGGSFHDAGTTANLGAVFVKILGEFRERYLVGYTPRGVSREGWHRLEVRVKGKRVDVKARPGYFAN